MFRRSLRNVIRLQLVGNIRELENVVEHAFILCGSNTIMPKHLPKRLYIKLSTLTTLPDSRKDDLAEAEQQP